MNECVRLSVCKAPLAAAKCGCWLLTEPMGLQCAYVHAWAGGTYLCVWRRGQGTALCAADSFHGPPEMRRTRAKRAQAGALRCTARCAACTALPGRSQQLAARRSVGCVLPAAAGPAAASPCLDALEQVVRPVVVEDAERHLRRHRHWHTHAHRRSLWPLHFSPSAPSTACMLRCVCPQAPGCNIGRR